MALSVFDLFKIGIGPSSSHTVGPMVAARLFVESLGDAGAGPAVQRIKVELMGSLGATGKGHGSDKAVILGLMGERPDEVDIDSIDARLQEVHEFRTLPLPDGRSLRFDPVRDLVLHKRRSLPFHPNAMLLTAFDADGECLLQRTYYSVGGGFVLDEEAAESGGDNAPIKPDERPVPLPFRSGDALLDVCRDNDLSIAGVMRTNEVALHGDTAMRQGLLEIWQVMQACVQRGCQQEGVLPGGMQVKRRAASMYRSLSSQPEASLRDPLTVIDWVNLYALAVNEENAAGGRVVTAPTNGAAGHHSRGASLLRSRFCPSASNDEGVVEVSACRRRHRDPVQGKRVHIGCRSRLSG